MGEGWPIGFGTQNKYGTVEEGNFVLKYNFEQKKVFCVWIIAHLFIILENKKKFSIVNRLI